MEAVIWLVLAGAAGGFMAGLLGIGGGVIFAPVLLFAFGALGVPPEEIAPLVVGSSLFCTMLAAASGAYAHSLHDAVDARTALLVGAGSAIGVYVVKTFVTTQQWYTPQVFSIVFACVLAVVAVRMLGKTPPTTLPRRTHVPAPLLGGVGLASGSIAAAVGIGGGIILVPAFHRLLHFPMRRASGTSSATIVLTALVGTILYAFTAAPDLGRATVGYVDFGRSLALAVPAVGTARAGVYVAHHVDTRYLRWAFAVFALVAAVRLVFNALE